MLQSNISLHKCYNKSITAQNTKELFWRSYLDGDLLPFGTPSRSEIKFAVYVVLLFSHEEYHLITYMGNSVDDIKYTPLFYSIIFSELT